MPNVICGYKDKLCRYLWFMHCNCPKLKIAHSNSTHSNHVWSNAVQKKSELISWNGCYHHKIGREERRNVTQDKKLPKEGSNTAYN